MTDKEILEKAVKKAIDNGWKLPNLHTGKKATNWHVPTLDKGLLKIDNPLVHTALTVSGPGITFDVYHVGDVIFNHDFAKALFGENYRTDLKLRKSGEPLKNWEFELANMAIADDPLKYIESTGILDKSL